MIMFESIIKPSSLYHHLIIISRMSMVKALTEIVSVDIGENLVSMSVVDKENQSGLKYNQRLFIVVHGVFFGYVSKVKMNEQPNKINIADAKVKIPMKNLYSVQISADLLRIKFSMEEEGKIVPKEWVLKTASEKMANFWKQLLQYEIKMRSKSPPKKQKAGSQIKQKSPQKPVQSSQVNATVAQNQKKQEKVSPPKQKPKQQTKPIFNQPNKPKEQTFEASKPKTFQNPLFEDDSDSEEQDRRKSARKSGRKQRKMKQQSKVQERKLEKVQPPSPNKQKDSPRVVNKSHQIQEQKKQVFPTKVKQNDDTKVQSEQKKENKLQLKLQKIVQEEVEQSPNVANQQFNKSPSKIVPRQQKRPSRIQSHPEPAKPQKFNKGFKQSDFIDNILHALDQQNNKFPINQLTYNRQQVQKLVKLYGKNLPQSLNEKERTQKLLNHIMQSQRSKMKKTGAFKIPQASPWIFKQIVLDQSANITNFQAKCTSLMPTLLQQLSSKQYKTFSLKSQNKQLITLQHEDILIKIPLVIFNEARNGRKILNEKALKNIKKQFKYFKFLFNLTKNTGKIRIPLSCLCEYDGIVALFKAKCVLGDKERVMEKIEEDVIKMQELSKLPLRDVLLPKLKPLKQLYYNQLRTGQTSNDFRYCVIQQVSQLFPLDLNMGEPTADHQIRYQLIYNSGIETVIPFSGLSGNKQSIKAIQSLSRILQDQLSNVIKALNNEGYYFIHPKQLSHHLHEAGINMRYLKQISEGINNYFVKSLLLSQMVARTAKVLLKKTFQDIHLQKSNKKLTQQQKRSQIKQRYIDFLNCLFGISRQSNALWDLITTNMQQKFSISLDPRSQLSKGQLLLSISHHCNVQFNWSELIIDKIFTTDRFLQKDKIKDIKIKVKSYIPNDIQFISLMGDRLKDTNMQNFTYLGEKFDLKHNKLPLIFNHFEDLNDQIRLYLSNFIEPEQVDWSTNYSHLSIYDNNSPSLVNWMIDIRAVKWHLHSNNRYKYLSKFNEITNKISNFYGNNHPLLSQLYIIFATHHKSKGQIEDSINFYKSALLNYSAIYGDHHLKVGECYYTMGQHLYTITRYSDAEDYLLKSKQIINRFGSQVVILKAKIYLHLSLIHYRYNKYSQSSTEAATATEIFQAHEANDKLSYEDQRAQSYQLLFLCSQKLDSKAENISLALRLQSKLQYFKQIDNFAEVLAIIIQSNINNLRQQNKTSLKGLIQNIPIKHSINFYKKSYDLLQSRIREKKLFATFKKYTQNSSKITEMVYQKNLLKVWQNFQKIYERQTLFDFIALMQQFIYLIGKERLLSL